MAFATTYWQCISPAKPKLFLYKTTDANATFEADSYFDSVADQLAEGDQILVVGTTGGTVESSLMVVRAVGVVKTADVMTTT